VEKEDPIVGFCKTVIYREVNPDVRQA